SAQGGLRSGRKIGPALFLLPLPRAGQLRHGAVDQIQEGEQQGLELGGIPDPFEPIFLDPVGEPIPLGGAFAVWRKLEAGERRPGQVDLHVPARPFPESLDADAERRIPAALRLRLVPGLDPLEDLHGSSMLRPSRARGQLRRLLRGAQAGLDRAVHRAASQCPPPTPPRGRGAAARVPPWRAPKRARRRRPHSCRAAPGPCRSLPIRSTPAPATAASARKWALHPGRAGRPGPVARKRARRAARSSSPGPWPARRWPPASSPATRARKSRTALAAPPAAR